MRGAADDGRRRAGRRIRTVADGEIADEPQQSCPARTREGRRRMIRALEFGAVRLVAAIVSALPMRVVRRIGAGLGRTAYRVDRTHRRTALENLAAAFPSK